MAIAGVVAIPIALSVAIEVYGTQAVGAYLAEEAAETIFEEATGIPIITDPVDIFQYGGKKAVKEAPVIVGEGMKRVSMEAAKHPGSIILNNMPKFTGTPHQVTSKMMTYNRQWLLQQMRSGRPIIDIGLDPTRGVPSIFYQMEQNMMKNYLKLHPGAF